MTGSKQIQLFLLGFFLFLFSFTTAAQGVLEEVTVTARKRSESLIDIPVTMTAFTAEEIENAGIESVHDFISLTPNMTVVQTQNVGNTFVTIRGVSQARNSDMPVAVLIDGVLLSNPAQFNQELFDIEQIEVLKGPQGALYGRNAIGGAITINTKQPGDELEGKINVGYDSGPGYKVQGSLSGPFPGMDDLKFRASISYKDTDGFLMNENLNTEADPFEDLSGRFKLLWQPNDQFTADARFSFSKIDTTALYFVINKDLAGTLPTVGGPVIPANNNTTVAHPREDNSNFTGVPILSDHLGDGEKDMYNVSLKMDYETDIGTFTSITAWDDTEELLTGDAFDFRPGGPGQWDPVAGLNFNAPPINPFGPFTAPSLQNLVNLGIGFTPADGVGGIGFGPSSFGPNGNQFLAFNNTSLCGFVIDFKGIDQFGLPQNVMDGLCSDWNQSQWLTVESWSQEFRFTSPADNRFRYILGGYFIATDRFISTGNMVEDGTLNPVYKTPRSTTGFPFDPNISNPQATFLSDSQDNFAWAVFADLAYDVTESFEVNLSLRYDRDTREQTAETPQGFLSSPLQNTGGISGSKRKESWDALQPKISLRWHLQDNLTLYTTLSRGFRSGGFNQTGVGAAGVAGVQDTFDEQIADTMEMGLKGEFFDSRLSTSLSAFHTNLSGAYYFIFLVSSSTQNLGSLDEVEYKGVEFEAIANPFEGVNLNFAVAINDSKIKQDADPNLALAIGKHVPLTSDFTINFGGSYYRPLGTFSDMLGNVAFYARADYQIIGQTYWGPGDPDPDFTSPFIGSNAVPWDVAPRDNVDLLDIRFGFKGDNWSVMGWGKNVLGEDYNQEFSHPFVFPAVGAQWGADVSYQF